MVLREGKGVKTFSICGGREIWQVSEFGRTIASVHVLRSQIVQCVDPTGPIGPVDRYEIVDRSIT